MQSAVSRPRALNVTGILNASFRLYREQFWTYLTIIMIIEIPVLMLLSIFWSINNTTLMTFQYTFLSVRWDMTSLSILALILMADPLDTLSLVVLAVVHQIHAGILINATAQIYHTGSTSVLQAYSVRIISIAMIGLLGLVNIIVSTITLVPYLVFLGILLTLPFVCIYQIVMLENPNPFAAIVRNWYLIQGSVLRIIGLMLLLLALYWVLYVLPISLLTSILSFMSEHIWLYTGIPDILIWGQAVLGYLISLLLLSFSTIVFTLLYFELRARRDGYDLEHKAQQHFDRS
ncbi:MAG: hypothetical protein AAGF95_07875 [Chloroflexota bacterium]